MAEVLDRVRALAPSIRKRSEEIEAARTLPLDLVDDLVAAGCFRMFVPPTSGGEGLGLSDGLRVIEELSGYDGSTGWTVMIGSSAPVLLAFAERRVFDELYASSPDVLAAGTVAPKGTLTRVEGGYRVDGQWPFASGCRHASWVAVQGVVLEDGEPERMANGMPVMRMALLPATEIEIVDTWRVAGLRGTGSDDIRVAGVVCPEERTFSLFTGAPCLSGGVFDLPVIAQLGLFVSSVALGVAGGALDDVAGLAAEGKRPAFSARRLAESPSFQERLGELDALHRAARALLYAESDGAAARSASGTPFSLLDRARMRATGPQVVAMATAVVDGAYTLGGGSSLYDGSPLQRRLRDVHTVTQHAAAGRDFFSLVGALLAGEPVDAMRI